MILVLEFVILTKELSMEYSLVKAYINLDAIKKNIQALKHITQKNSKFMAVVKADAYGHGAVKVAKKSFGKWC